MAAVEQQILVKIKALVDGLPQVQALANSVNTLNKGGSGFKRIGQDADIASNKVGGLTFRIKDTEKSLLGVAVKGSGATSVLLAAGSAAATFGAALAAIGVGAAALGFGAFVAEGIRFNAVIESAKIGIATIVSNTYDVVDAQGKVLAPVDAFNASLVRSEELERGLQKAAILTKFEFEDILGFFNSTVIASAGLKTDLDQIVRLTQDFALAAGAANIETQLVRTGIQQILTGSVTVRNPLARVLFPGESTANINKFLKEGKAAGDLVDRLEKKLQVFRLSANTVSQSFDAVASNVGDAFKLFAAQATFPLFDKLKVTLGGIINQIVDLTGDSVKLTPTFQSIADILGVILGFLGDQMIAAVDYILATIKDWVTYFEANKENLGAILMNVYAIAEQTAGIAIDLLSIVGDLGTANSNTSNWAALTQYVALLLGFIRDVLNVILGVFEGIAGVLSISISTFLSYISDTLAGIIQDTGHWLDALIPVAIAIDRIAQGLGAAGASITDKGTNRLLSGLNNEGLFGAQDRINQPFVNPFKTPAKSTAHFNARARTGGGDGGKGAAREAKERISQAQKLYDAIEKLQINNSNREVELAKMVNAQLQVLNKRRYDQGLISTEDYFNEKRKLELDDLAQQEKNLHKQEEFANTALSRDLGAISGKFSLNEDEIQAVIEQIRVAQESPGELKGANPKVLKQAVEYTKYLEQTAKITSDLKKIDKERENIATATTDAIKDQARVRLQQREDIKGELASTLGQDGVAASNALKKRISDELGKHLVDENKGVPGIEKAAGAIRDLGSIDISGVTDQLKLAGIDVDSLSEDTQTLLKLFRALSIAIDLNATNAVAGKLKSRADFDREGVSTAFDSGQVNSADALAANAAIKKQIISDLTAQYNKLKAVLDVVSADGGIVDPAQLDNANALYRLIQGITQNYGELELIQKQSDRDSQVFANASAEIDARRVSGAISSKQASDELEIAQEARIAGLQRELAELLKLDQALPDVAQKVAAVQGAIATMTNDMNSESIQLAQSINGTIGDAFSTFLDNIQSGTQSIGDSFRQLVAGLLLGIAKAIAQAILLKFILEPLGLTGGDSGGIGGFFSGLFGGKKHAEGGIISGAGTGVSDSIPALVSHGEGIIPAARVAGYGRGMIQSIIDGTFIPVARFSRFAVGTSFAGGSGSGGGRGAVRIINSLDPNLVKEFMSSAEGEEIITNIIGKNPGLIQRIV